MNPYYVLDVDERADDDTIRKAYLKAIRRFTPEKSPDRFQLIARAYEEIKDRQHRCELLLKTLDLSADSPAGVFAERVRVAPGQGVTVDNMNSFFRSLI